MGVSSALRSAVRGASGNVLKAVNAASTSIGKVLRVPARMATDFGQALMRSFNPRNVSPEDLAKSFKAAEDVDGAAKADPKIEAPLGTKPDGTPKTSVTGEAPPPKDATTEAPNTPETAGKRWAEVSPWLKGAGGTAILAGVGVGTWLTVCGVYLQNTDGVEVKITKIEKVKDTEKKYKFTYETQGGQKCGPPGAKVPCIQTAFHPCKNDTFTFRNTYTNPTLNDVTAVVTDVDMDSVAFELDLTNIGTGTPEWGFMTCHTSFKNQFRNSVREAVQLVVDLATDVGTPLGNAFCDVIPIPFICPDALDLGNWVVWLIVICCLLCCLALVFVLLT